MSSAQSAAGCGGGAVRLTRNKTNTRRELRLHPEGLVVDAPDFESKQPGSRSVVDIDDEEERYGTPFEL